MTADPLWAPWRMSFILGPRSVPEPDGPQQLLCGADPGCFLCQAAADPEDHRRHVVRRSPNAVAVLNLYPYNNGHILVAPRRHLARLDELSTEEQAEIMQMITGLIHRLESVLSPEGFNVGLNLGRVAGAGLPAHVHWHIVPRWTGDTNFMPVLAATNVIPQSLDALWEQLTESSGEEK